MRKEEQGWAEVAVEVQLDVPKDDGRSEEGGTQSLKEEVVEVQVTVVVDGGRSEGAVDGCRSEGGAMQGWL